MSSDQDTTGEPVAEAWTYRAVVETYDDEPDQCTIFPREIADLDRMTTWITAREDSFTALERMR
jgi:hypothetical protein